MSGMSVYFLKVIIIWPPGGTDHVLKW